MAPVTGTPTLDSTATQDHESQPLALGAMMVTFFMCGFITCLNDILIPHLKALFDLGYAGAMLVQFMFFGAYFVMGLPAGKILAHFGYKLSIVIALLTSATGALLFWPAAALPSYPLFLVAFFILAAGLAVFQAAANPYVTLLGPARSASSRLTMVQALNSVGTFLAPFFGGVLILSVGVLGADAIAKLAPADLLAYKTQQAQLVQMPYLGLAVTLAVIALVLWAIRLPALTDATEAADHKQHTFAEAWSYRTLRNGVIGIFVYVGAEVAIGSFLVNYLSQPSIGNLSEAEAAKYVAWYWGGAMIGRLLGFVLLARFNPRWLLGLFACVNIALVVTTMLASGPLAMYSIIAVGLFNSIMFPTIFSLAVGGLGPLTGKGSSLLIMAIVGGALIPVAQGLLADHVTGLHHAFILPVLCYLYIAWFGFKGSQAT